MDVERRCRGQIRFGLDARPDRPVPSWLLPVTLLVWFLGYIPVNRIIFHRKWDRLKGISIQKMSRDNIYSCSILFNSYLALNCDDSNPLYYPVGNCLYTTRVCSYAHFHLEELFISWMWDCIWTITLMVMRICGTLFCKLRWSWSSLMVYLPSSRIRCLKTSKFIIATIVALYIVFII